MEANGFTVTVPPTNLAPSWARAAIGDAFQVEVNETLLNGIMYQVRGHHPTMGDRNNFYLLEVLGPPCNEGFNLSL